MPTPCKLPMAEETRVAGWLSECLSAPSDVDAATKLKDAPGREVWDVAFCFEGRNRRAALLVFKPCEPDAVNTSLGPSDTADKCRMAMSELRLHGIRTPSVIGSCTISGESAILSSWVASTKWSPEARIEAAQVLGRLHALDARQLSPGLQVLLDSSDPRECRTTGGEAPSSGMRALVHGDFFSKNILPTDVDGSICVIDWETFGWGDPMWDLGFLLGADRSVSTQEADSVIAAYSGLRPVDNDCLQWHRDHWRQMWDARSSQTSADR